MTITEHPTTPPLAPISTPRPAGPFRPLVEPGLPAVVHQVGVHEPTDPPLAPVLPPGAVPVAYLLPRRPLPDDATADAVEADKAAARATLTALQDLLAYLELPPFDLFASGGIHVWTMATPTSERDWWVTVDFQSGGTRESAGEHPATAGQRILYNWEAGRCHIGHPMAMRPAIDRRYSHLPDLPAELAEPLRGAFRVGPAVQLHFLEGREAATATADEHGRHWPDWFRVLVDLPRRFVRVED